MKDILGCKNPGRPGCNSAECCDACAGWTRYQVLASSCRGEVYKCSLKRIMTQTWLHKNKKDNVESRGPSWEGAGVGLTYRKTTVNIQKGTLGKVYIFGRLSE